jgi:hypothetical protein
MAGEIKETADKKALEISRADVRLSSDPKLVETTSSSNDIPEDTPRNMADTPASDENTGIRSEIKQATGKLKGMATSMFNSFEPPSDPANMIKDEKFIEDLRTLTSLHSFLIKEATSLPEKFKLGRLNRLKAAGPGQEGRAPSQEEWEALEEKTQVLFAHLSDADRKSFLASQMPNFLPKLAVWLVVVSIGSMILSVFMAEVTLLSKGLDGALMVLFFLLWLMSLGAIGSAAFIGFNAIAVTSDITFDISDPRLIVQRIVLGALFALFFTLPFGFHEFLAFVKSLSAAALNKTTVPTKSEVAFTNQSLLLIMPFVLGYSTSLVILILNRIISSASTLFGAQEAPAKAKAKSKPA